MLGKVDIVPLIVEHRNAKHPDSEAKFEMRVVAFPKTNLQRQALEAHQTNINAIHNVLNRRWELGQNLTQN